MAKTCLCIGGPRDGQYLALEDHYRIGDVYRVALQPKLSVVGPVDMAEQELTYDTFLYILDKTHPGDIEHWFLRPHNEPVAASVARLFNNYRPVPEPKPDFDWIALQRLRRQSP